MTTDGGAGADADGVRAVRAVARLARLFECSLPDVSLTQYRVLATVEEGGERASHLAKALVLAKPTVTAAVDALVERGWVTREPVPQDRRALRIALTQAGREALRTCEEAMAAKLAHVLDGAVDPGATRAALAGLAPLLERR